jgi:hypothetical protein
MEKALSEPWRALGIVKQFGGGRERPEEFEQQRLFLGIYAVTSAELRHGPDFRQIVCFDLPGFDVFGQRRVLRTSRLRHAGIYKN